MENDPDKDNVPKHFFRRRSIRLRGYDYSEAGFYFVTICVQNRESLFGRITEGCVELNPPGEMVQKIWKEMPARYPGVETDAFIVMPNHVHGIIVLGESPSSLSLPEVVRRFKRLTTRAYIRGVREKAWKPFSGRLWQHNYWERVIRNESELDKAREYVLTNPCGDERSDFCMLAP